MEAGKSYSELSDTVVVFITPFDPFGEKRLRYTFQSLCIENNQLSLEDGVTRVVLNAAGNRGEVSEELKGFLKLVTGNTTCSAGSFADRVQNQVIKARQNAEWRREYMDWKMTLLNERVKGREEGRKEGRKEGLMLLQIETIKKKVLKGVDLPEIAEALEMDADLIRPVWEAVKAAAPDYNEEEILEALTAGN